MALSYEYSIGSVRVRENYMLNNADIEQMLSCKNETELISYLSDKGYGEGESIDEILKNHTDKMWDYLKSIAPDFEIFNPFFYLNDIHNLKVVLKGTMSARDYAELLIKPCTIDADTLKKAVENRKFSLLPPWLEKPSDKAYELLAFTKDARLSDAVLDKAVMEEILRITENSGIEFLYNYFKTYIFYCNVKTAIRATRTGTTKDYLKKALCPVDGFNETNVINSSLKGLDSLLDALSKVKDYDCDKAIDAYKESPSAFERFADNKLILMAKEFCKRGGQGAEPMLGYYLGAEMEKKVIHIIASGIRTKTDTADIRERLREIYG